MKSPAMSLESKGEDLFLALGEKSVKVPLPYDRETFSRTLRTEGIDADTVTAVESFLERVRNHFQRPDRLADAA